jgi:homoserine kinase type II
MAVYTDISETDIAAFLELYDIGALRSYKGIAEGVENSNFLLQTDRGSFILTLYEKRVNPDDLPFFLGLMDHLAARGISCPLPVHQKNGKTIGQLADRPAAIVTFLEGMWMRRPSADHAREVGKALAAMHLAGEGFAIKRENALSVSGWRPLWDAAAPRADAVEPGLSIEVEADLRDLERHWPSDLPRGVCHADMFPDNVFFLGEKLSGIIDFYFACNDLFVYDLSVCLNAWCFEKDNAYNLTKGRALLQGYQSVRPLTRDEARVLPLMARGSALRFMLTRLYDWLNTPEGAMVVKKDPLEYVRKMRFHRKIVSPVEYGLSQP